MGWEWGSWKEGKVLWREYVGRQVAFVAAEIQNGNLSSIFSVALALATSPTLSFSTLSSRPPAPANGWFRPIKTVHGS